MAQAAAVTAGEVLIDGSRLIIEGLARAGADVFVGYPITPANLLYLYATRRFSTALAAPDEITTLQWMSGFAAAGRVPVTATSFPGYALMIESINMAWMMELPMVIVLAQRLGPATGTATCGAQGDLSVVAGTLSGGYTLPTLGISDLHDCWTLAAKAVEVAVSLRTPVVLLSSKEMVMTMRSFDLATLESVSPCVPRSRELVPPLCPLGDSAQQVRLTASTHDAQGILQNTTREALATTLRLQRKVERHLGEYTRYELDEEPGASTLVIAWDVSAAAAREAVQMLRGQGEKVSLLIPKTLLPVPPDYLSVIARYAKVIVAEENDGGQLRTLLFGAAGRAGLRGVNAIGRMLTPSEIIAEVRA